jgi:hypothetical protein
VDHGGDYVCSAANKAGVYVIKLLFFTVTPNPGKKARAFCAWGDLKLSGANVKELFTVVSYDFS